MSPWLRRAARPLVAVLCASASLCACTASPEADAAERAAAPHLDAFARFDAWARRTMDAHAAWRDRSAMAETLWSPLRTEREVHDAVVRAETHPPLRMHDRGEWPDATGWFQLRHPTLGRLRVRETTLGSGADDGEERAVVVLARGPQSEDGLAIEVDVAFDDGP